MLELRVRTKLPPEEIEAKQGKILSAADYDVLLTGRCRITKLDGRPLAVYLPGVLTGEMDTPGVYEILHRLHLEANWSVNRGKASGTPRRKSNQTRSYTRPVPSQIVGAIDPTGQQKYCRLTAWTGKNLPDWQQLRPLFTAVAGHLEEHVPERYAAQMAEAERTHPGWVVPGTPFTTVTVNNTFPTGVHTDKGDLDAGFSTIACLRRGPYTGGQLVFAEYRIAVSLQHGDLLLMDAHDWHGNVNLVCECGPDAVRSPGPGFRAGYGPCERCGAERISVVSYFRTRLTGCGSPEDEHRRGNDFHERMASRPRLEA